MVTQLNTLYVMTQKTLLSKTGECIEVRMPTGKKLLPIHMIGGGIVTFGNVMITPFLMGHCAERGIQITCLTESGRFLAVINHGCRGNVFLRRQQYRMSANDDISAKTARYFLLGKFANSRTVLRRAARERTEEADVMALSAAADEITTAIQRLTLQECSLETMRGFEGDIASKYFSLFGAMLQPSGFSFHNRERRPPKDPVNALLSFLYVLLAHDCESALLSVGLDAQMGFLHRDRSGRASLALDLMEELRALLVDRMVLALLNRKQLAAKDFESEITGAVKMSESAKKTVLAAWQERKKKEIVHPYTQEKIPMGLVPFVQASLLARFLRGDSDGYPPFIWR